VVVWVEVKHGASPHEQQLDNYLNDIVSLNARAHAVVLLAPRQSYPFEPSPPAPVVRCTWQDTASNLHPRRHRPAEQGFLVRELASYLREEGLMDAEAITPVHLVALAERERAEEAVARACEIASAFIARTWNDREHFWESGGKARYGTG
jgi:hypothetical protein